MYSKEFKTILMFNGEIYNHSELRKDLKNKGLKEGKKIWIDVNF